MDFVDKQGCLVASFKKEYKPEYCEKLIEVQSEGRSVNSFCAEIGIGYSTFNLWRKKYDDFYEAADIAKSAQIAFVEKDAFAHRTDKCYQVKWPMFQLERQHKDHYGENRIADTLYINNITNATTSLEKGRLVEQALFNNGIEAKQAKESMEVVVALNNLVNEEKYEEMLDQIIANQGGK